MKNILVIDDNEDIRSVIFGILAYAGYTVHQAGNGREGILMVLEQRPDLILCDVGMPEMDGYSTLAAIRKVPGGAAIPFIMITGSLERDEFRRAMVRGADDSLLKPFSALELIAAVESRLARPMQAQGDAHQRLEKTGEPALLQCSPEAGPAAGPVAAAA